MRKLKLRSLTVKCIDCGFFGYREGGYDKDGAMYLGSKFWECHDDDRKGSQLSDSYVSFSEDGNRWNVIGCYHRVWSLWGSNSNKERDNAKIILAEQRDCKYYFPYESGYEPAGHNQMRQDERNRRIMLRVGMINAGAVVIAALLAALITAILRM
jgi:hypothetical protein